MYQVELTQSLFPAQRDTPFEPTTIAALLRDKAEQHGDVLALREILADGSIGREWTYAELMRDSERLERALASRHRRGARVAVFAHNAPEWILTKNRADR